MHNIKLANDTVDKKDIKKLISWLKQGKNITMGEQTERFERIFSEFMGVNHSVYVNSGSSANLLAVYSMMLSNSDNRKDVIVPAVSWVTTVSPVIQLGLNPILCDCSMDNLGIDTDMLEMLCEKHRPLALILVHVLGLPCDMERILEICNKYNVFLIEDTCEAMGSEVKGKKLGSFGNISTFSMYYAHTISSGEGGIVSTNSDELCRLLKMTRSHGWDRNLSIEDKEKIRKDNSVDNFHASFTFFVPGFNVRPTDIQATIAISQMEKINKMVDVRNSNYLLYDSLIKNSFWKPSLHTNATISNHAYPVITPKLDELVCELEKNGIETRPLVCGSMEKQVFWKKLYGDKITCPNASIVHDFGCYLPNNHEISKKDIQKICKIVNKVTK